MCAQDWTHHGWELPAELESVIFGCDLWIEVTSISRLPECSDGIDNDLDGHIDWPDDDDCESSLDNSEFTII